MDSPPPTSPTLPILHSENEDNVERNGSENGVGMEVEDVDDEELSVVESSVINLKRKERGDGNEDEEDKEELPDIDEEDDLKLDDEDFYLLEENLGYKVKKRFKRVRRIDSSDEEDNSQKNDKEEIANELFDLSDDERDKTVEVKAKKPPARSRQVGSDSESESDDDVRDFIVDEFASSSKSRGRRSRGNCGNDYPKHLDQEIHKAQDIFGADFVYDDIIQEDGNEDGDDYDDDIETRKTRVKAKKTEIIKFYEPAEIENKFLDKKSIEINRKDEPERYQRRAIPVTAPLDDIELDEEANWILPYFKNESLDFDTSTKKVVVKDDGEDDWGAPPVLIRCDDDNASIMPSCINNKEVLIEEEIVQVEEQVDPKLEKIKTVLNLMRNEMFDIPYIALYYDGPIRPLTRDHIWKIFDLDMKYCQLQQRKRNLYKLMNQMKDFTVDSDLLEYELKIRNLIKLKPITEEDLNDINSINSLEDLADYQKRFSFYYGFLVPYLKEYLRKKESEAAAADDENNEEPSKIKETRKFKISSRASVYESGLKSFAVDAIPLFSISFEEIASSITMSSNYPFKVVKPCAIYPHELAETIIEDNQLRVEPSILLKRAKNLLAQMIAHDPKIKKCIREIFLEKATIDVRPTTKGENYIDELHPLYRLKYLTKKPHQAFKGAEFLHFLEAEKEKLIVLTINIGQGEKELFSDIGRVLCDTLGNEIVEAWNHERVKVVESAFEKIIFPEMRNMLKTKMKLDAHEFVIQACRQEIKERISVGPFFCEIKRKENCPEWSIKDGIRVMSFVFSDDHYSCPIYVTAVDQNGEYYEHLELSSLLKRPKVKLKGREEFNSEQTYELMERQIKEFKSLSQVLTSFKPHVIVIGGKTYESLRVKREIMNLIEQINEETFGDFPFLSVEVIATDLSQTIAGSKNTNMKDSYNLPLCVKEGVSLARRIRDPLLEFSQLCNNDDILCLKLHPLQGSVNQDVLLNAINSEFVNIINEVGVDFEKSLSDPYYSNLLKFISGLGPCKAFNLTSAFKRKPAKLENRTQLVTIGGLGPLVFRNCSGFIKLNTEELIHTSDYYIEHLDSTRIIPEYYEEARLIAIDALDRDRDMDNSNVIEDIFKTTKKGLEDLDLEKYATYKREQGLELTFNETSLAMIRDELDAPFMDKRHPYVSNLEEETLNMLIKDFKIQEGKLYIGKVLGIVYYKPNLLIAPDLGEDDQWRCQMCDVRLKNCSMTMANHVEKCRGEVRYVRVELEDGIVGILPYDRISDTKFSRQVFDEMIFVDKAIYVRVAKFVKEGDYMSIILTSKGSDLKDDRRYFRNDKREMIDNDDDKYYDISEEMEASKKIAMMKSKAEKNMMNNLSFILRKSNHQDFKNVTHHQALEILEDKPIGSLIIRPSSKGVDYLTLVLKITDTIYQYISIREEEKPSDAEVGSKLFIGDEEFEDLNEITDNNVLPITQFNEELMSHKSYCMGIDGDKNTAAQTLKYRKEVDPNIAHYLVSASKKYPGTFLLSYLLKNNTRHEYITVSRIGYHFRGETFTSFLTLISWFKRHFGDVPKYVIPPPASVVTSVIDDDSFSVLSRHLGKSY